MKISKEKILFLTRSMGVGGTENVILQLCEILKPEVKEIVVCSCGGINVKVLDEMGIRHYEIPDMTSKNPRLLMRVYKTIKKIIEKEEITIIHSHHRMAAFYAEIITHSNKNIIKIANVHNTFTNKIKLTRFAYKKTNLIAVGEKVKENLLNIFKISENQIAVIHNSVKPFGENVQIVRELYNAKKEGYICIGNIGRLSEQKGMQYFIKAAAQVLKFCPKSKFFIVGDGEDRSLLEKLVKSLFVESDIIFLGYRKDIQNIIFQMDFIVLSSLWEGLPLTPIEAFSVGRPVVATAVDGTQEIVINEKNGILVKAKSIDELVAAMVQLINNEAKRRELGTNAYKQYIDKFSFAKMSQKYIEYYEEILSKYR